MKTSLDSVVLPIRENLSRLVSAANATPHAACPFGETLSGNVFENSPTVLASRDHNGVTKLPIVDGKTFYDDSELVISICQASFLD